MNALPLLRRLAGQIEDTEVLRSLGRARVISGSVSLVATASKFALIVFVMKM